MMAKRAKEIKRERKRLYPLYVCNILFTVTMTCLKRPETRTPRKIKVMVSVSYADF